MEDNFFQEQGQERLSEDERRILLLQAREALVEQERGREREQELQGQDDDHEQDAAARDLPELLVAEEASAE